MKIVINGCFGGFSLSRKAIAEYATRKGWGTVVEKGLTDWEYTYLAPSLPAGTSLDVTDLDSDMRPDTISDRDIDRACPVLVALVEEWGEKASGSHSGLYVVEIPDDVKWQIEEYDGREHIAEVHRTWS